MVADVLIEMLKSGAIAFVGSKLTKALNQKEISEFIAAGGWCAIGIGSVKILTPFFKALHDSIIRTTETVDKISNIFEKMGGFIDKIEGFMGK
jgi:hypothetical protein